MTGRVAAIAERWRTGTIVLGVGLVGLGLLLVWSGLTALSQGRDADGYLLSDPLSIERPSRAVVANDVDLLRGHYECAAEESFLLGLFSSDDVRMRGVSTGSEEIFIGIAPADAVEEYLGDVPHAEITEWDCDVDDITPVAYAARDGMTVPGPPGSERFWVAGASGSGEQTVDWRIEPGEWSVVVMNADASSGVAAEVRFGALAPSSLDLLAWSSFAVGLIAVAGGGALLWLVFRRSSRRA